MRLVVLLAALTACGGPPDDGGDDAVDSLVVDTDPVVPEELRTLVPDACAGGPAFDGAGFDPDHALPASSAFTARLVPLVAILDGDAAAAAAIADDAALDGLAAGARDGLDAARACAGEDACVRAALVPAPDDVAAAADRLAALVGDDGATGLVARHLRPSGAFARWADDDPATMLRAAWTHTVGTLAVALDTAASELDPAALDAVVDAVALDADAPWYAPLRAVTEAALIAAGRDEGFRYEPLADGENAAALARLATLDLARFPFALILVPGQGPTTPDEAISLLSTMRADLAAARWKAGLAPFVVASGGHVHPDRTPYAEAIEIKRYLMATHGLPEHAILVDPYARHTTTNLRDVGRLLLRQGFPADAVMLVTSDAFQSAYIVGMAPRCEEELGYLPWRTIVALPTGTDSCATVARDVLFVDAADPLDP